MDIDHQYLKIFEFNVFFRVDVLPCLLIFILFSTLEIIGVKADLEPQAKCRSYFFFFTGPPWFVPLSI